MKQLIASHHESIYQICKCFRNGESTGHLHSPEFTMLEYYTMEADYNDSLNLTEELFSFLMKQNQCENKRLKPPFIKMTMEEAFFEFAGFDLYKCAELGSGAMAEECRKLGLESLSGTSFENGISEISISLEMLYNLIFVHQVEPNLPKDKLVALMDYPAFVPCLAQKHKNGYAMERWELYADGLELANCYTEERNPEIVKQFFLSEQKEKQQNALINHHIDEDYWKIFSDFPKCSGTAMGLDRLIMVMTGRSSIDSVLPFPMSSC
jgi:lysyl-tRNA synthetase class 2